MLKELKKVPSTEKMSVLLNKWRKTPVSLYKNENTLLHVAIYTGNLDVVKIVYEVMRECNFHKKALIHKNTKNETPLDLAYRLSFLDIFWWLQNAESYRKIKKPAPDWWADFFRNLEKSNINVMSNWVTYKGTEARLKKYVAHYRGSVTKKSFLFAKEIGVSYDMKVPRFLKTPIRWYHESYNYLSFLMGRQAKTYPWKYFDISKKNHHLTCFYVVIDPIEGKKFKDKSHQEKSNPLSLFCAISDQVLQDEFLTKKVSTFNFLTLNYTQVPEPRPAYHTELSFLPFKISPKKKMFKKARFIMNRLKWGVFWKKFLRVDLEIKFFNHFFIKKSPVVKDFISGKVSRFVTYSYFGDHKVDEETFKHEFIGLGRANPFSKISLAFHFKNDQLVLSMDVHPQILEDREQGQVILNKIKNAIEEYVKD